VGGSTNDAERRALLVCSPGGHLLEMLFLEPSWRDLDTTWVTLPAADVEHLLANHRKILGHGPTNRSLRNLVRNLVLAVRVIRRERPDVILSAGAALAVPFFLVGKLYGCRLVYVESLARTSSLSMSGRMVYPLADAFFVQWPGAARGRAKAVHAGCIL
jgi:UDP-N-acetylglucosamine:LPS N-acetylglucosamine transferase